MIYDLPMLKGVFKAIMDLVSGENSSPAGHKLLAISPIFSIKKTIFV